MGSSEMSPVSNTSAWTAHVQRKDWAVLAITMLFWLFDGYETYTLLVTVSPALNQLLPASHLPNLSHYSAYLISITLFGWATGGILGGLLGDRLGRRKTMIIAILLYGVFTGSSALAHSWGFLAITRLLTGIGIGAEWGVGTSLLQEAWPAQARTKGAGLLQAGFSLGSLLASGLWILLGGHLGVSWRMMYVIGIVPAILIAVLARRIPESTRWVRVKTAADAGIRSINMKYLFCAIGVSISITLGWWAISSWVPSYAASLVTGTKLQAYYSGMAGVLYNVGEIFGCILFGFFADSMGRRWTGALYLLGSLIITPIVFLVLHNAVAVVVLQLANGYLTGGLYSWYTIHPPELFPTRVRASAISTIFNITRYLAMLGPILAAYLLQALGGFGPAASTFGLIYVLGIILMFFLPETKGLQLPD
ncbi:MFS transporter [Alicyclobacillus acidoterrestris]|uniref:MFS transporter n=1 Tax=Alicyclobacillus acidoterrestris (strain ATCC 49025 / DSM 3922 / CIP 106132 / NCIMB 13137 / GD3B) TaxID=1356854 RepID=T0C9R4_ALIAG|nr:MFS transporter [Alicyclobacillus acidoterrestris]EPZ52898.1 hypothetical protein N007_02010 [Alicyclobacillus acidoterrestris ATCC 49025]UNO49110.1 MFS transporter [Alicyclobacillus acidoterrestris]